MRRSFSSALCAAGLLLSGVSIVASSPPAVAQASTRLGFDFFHNRLVHDGRWIHHPVWGDVWRPRPSLVGPDFEPYTNGYWEYTDDYGWYWVSNDPFDDVVYHYGRWVYDPRLHWLWIPGYTWSPAWVLWREGDDYTGWMPLPPDEEFVSGTGPGFGLKIGSIGLNFYTDWYGGRVDPDRFFVFVDNRHLVERDYRHFAVPRDRVKIIINRTRPITTFEVVNNRVVNRGVDIKMVERATGRRIAPVSAKAVIKPGAVITTVDEGNQVRSRERVAHPIDVPAVRRSGGGRDEQSGSGRGPGEGTAEPPSGSKMPSEGQDRRQRERSDNTKARETTAASPEGGSGEAAGRARNGGNGSASDSGSGTEPSSRTGAVPANNGTEDKVTPRNRGTRAGKGDADQNGSAAEPASGPTSNKTGAEAGSAGETPTTMPRHRGKQDVNGANARSGGNTPAQAGSAAPTPNAQPDSAPAQKKKRKSPPEEKQPDSPQQ